MAPQLPRVFALKLSSNDKYLACANEHNEVHDLVKFRAEDITDLSVVYEWEPAKSGGAGLGHVKCPQKNKYWVRRKSDHKLWIAVEADKPVEDKSSWECTLFQVLFSGADGSKINLKQVELDYYVVAWQGDEPFNLCLYADGPNRGGLDTFSVTELVPVSTEISDVKFRLADAKINNSTTANIVQSTLVNNSESHEIVTGELHFSVVESSTWKLASSSLTSGLTLTINSAIPTIVDDGKVELSGEEVTGLNLDSGKPWEKTVTASITYRVAIPPKGKVVVTLKATHASADIPFSYTESITFADGRVITRHVHDGIFTRVNYYDFKVIKN